MKVLVIFLIISNLSAATNIMPSTCNNLLPNYGDYISFLESTGDMWSYSKPNMALKIYRILAVRKIYDETTKESINPINTIIKSYLCSCYDENGRKLFTSDSREVRQCMTKNAASMIKEAEDALITARVKELLIERSNRLRDKHISTISKLKAKAYNTEKNNVHKKIQSKIKSK